MKIKKAFSLVEILVVVTIISILASIAAVSYSRFVKQSRDARRKTDIEQIRAAIELYRNFKGAYPTPRAVPGMLFGTGDITDGSVVPTITYMSKIPNDPMSEAGYRYYYESSGTYQDYLLCAFIENGETSITTHGCKTGPFLECNYCMGPYGQK